MGTIKKHVLGRERKAYVKAESSYGTQVFPAGTDAFRALTLSLGSPSIQRIDRADFKTTRSLQERVTGKYGPVEWTIEGYVVPSGTAGTPPDMHELFKAALGSYTNVAGTSDTYDPTDTQGAQGSLSIYDNTSDVLLETVVGAIVQEMSIKGANGDVPHVSFSGSGKKHVLTGVTTLNGALSGGETDITVTDEDAGEVGSLIKIGTSDGSGSGHQVTAKSGMTWTVSPAVSGAQSDGADVIPYTPTTSTAGSPIPGVLGSMTIDGTAFPVVSYEVSLNNNHQLLHDEALEKYVTDYVEDNREVKGQFTVKARQDQLLWLGKRKAFATHAVVLTLGTTAGSILTINLPTIELEFANVDKPESGAGIITLPFHSLGTTNELQLVFT